MKITLQELKQLIRESIQEEIKNEGIMDTVRGFFGGKKTPVETKPEEKSVNQNNPNIFTGGKIKTVEDFGKKIIAQNRNFINGQLELGHLENHKPKKILTIF